jgi:hypothetical protein
VIARIWHGWTTHANADAYETLLRSEVLPGISEISGARGAYLLRTPVGNEVVPLGRVFPRNRSPRYARRAEVPPLIGDCADIDLRFGAAVLQPLRTAPRGREGRDPQQFKHGGRCWWRGEVLRCKT